MINVVIVSNNASTELALLDWQSDMHVSVVAPTSIEPTLETVLAAMPNIIIMEQNIDSLDANLLCHLLYEQKPTAQALILTNRKPTFEMLENTGFRARGYITREQRSSLAKAVRAVHEGEAWLPRKIVTEMLNRLAITAFESNEIHLKLVK